MTALIQHLRQIVLLSPQECNRIENTFTPVSLRKNDCWIREGQYCNHIAFVKQGKMRFFYLTADGSDTTCFFTTQNSFISSYTSFLTHTPTTENIAAIEDTELLVISRNELETLSDEIPGLHIFRRVIAENLFIAMEKRVAALQSQTAVKRYDDMIKENPDILLSVPLQYTASFLGVTPQHLSRLRKKQKRPFS